jgi:hypothetical protein
MFITGCSVGIWVPADSAGGCLLCLLIEIHIFYSIMYIGTSCKNYPHHPLFVEDTHPQFVAYIYIYPHHSRFVNYISSSVSSLR